MIGMGVGVGVVAIIVDAALGKAKLLRLPPLAIGIGIYLPMAVTLPIFIGSVLGWLYEKGADRTANPAFAKRMGVLLATGLIVGDSLANVGFAGIVAATGLPRPSAPGDDSSMLPRSAAWSCSAPCSGRSTATRAASRLPPPRLQPARDLRQPFPADADAVADAGDRAVHGAARLRGQVARRIVVELVDHCRIGRAASQLGKEA